MDRIAIYVFFTIVLSWSCKPSRHKLADEDPNISGLKPNSSSFNLVLDQGNIYRIPFAVDDRNIDIMVLVLKRSDKKVEISGKNIDNRQYELVVLHVYDNDKRNIIESLRKHPLFSSILPKNKKSLAGTILPINEQTLHFYMDGRKDFKELGKWRIGSLSEVAREGDLVVKQLEAINQRLVGIIEKKMAPFQDGLYNGGKYLGYFSEQVAEEVLTDSLNSFDLDEWYRQSGGNFDILSFLNSNGISLSQIPSELNLNELDFSQYSQFEWREKFKDLADTFKTSFTDILAVSEVKLPNLNIPNYLNYEPESFSKAIKGFMNRSDLDFDAKEYLPELQEILASSDSKKIDPDKRILQFLQLKAFAAELVKINSQARAIKLIKRKMAVRAKNLSSEIKLNMKASFLDGLRTGVILAMTRDKIDPKKIRAFAAKARKEYEAIRSSILALNSGSETLNEARHTVKNPDKQNFSELKTKGTVFSGDLDRLKKTLKSAPGPVNFLKSLSRALH